MHDKAAQHLSRVDPVMKNLVKAFGPCTIKPHKNYYQELVSSIIGQQLSLKAAAAIEARFIALFEGVFPTPEQILQKQPEQLRAVGFSRAKAAYVQDLATHILDGRLKITRLPTLSDNEIIGELTDIKGIGEWTAHMFLIFSLGRPDVLAVGDLGIRNGIKRLYDFKAGPTPAEVQSLAEQKGWSPYRSAACWYIWQSLDNNPA